MILFIRHGNHKRTAEQIFAYVTRTSNLFLKSSIVKNERWVAGCCQASTCSTGCLHLTRRVECFKYFSVFDVRLLRSELLRCYLTNDLGLRSVFSFLFLWRFTIQIASVFSLNSSKKYILRSRGHICGYPGKILTMGLKEDEI